MSYYRTKNTLHFDYIIDKFPLPEIDTVRDLGITFNPISCVVLLLIKLV